LRIWPKPTLTRVSRPDTRSNPCSWRPFFSKYCTSYINNNNNHKSLGLLYKWRCHRDCEIAYLCQVNFYGSRHSGHAPFSKIFKGSCPGLSMGTCMPNLKSVALTVLEKLSTGLIDRFAAHRHIQRMKTLSLSFTLLNWQR